MSQLFYVDIPTEECINDDDGAFKNIGVFTTKEEAIKFAQEHFGADKNGCICLVTG